MRILCYSIYEVIYKLFFVMRKEIESRIRDIVSKRYGIADIPGFSVAPPDDPAHGDYASNVALSISKIVKRPPLEIAQEIAANLGGEGFSRVDAVLPGFINIFLPEERLRKEIETILAKGDSYGAAPERNEKIIVEFVSANPTGPLTMANGRGGFYGDALSNILEKSGYGVTREYYVNDSGNQVRLLGESIEAAQGKIPDREEYYKGEYIKTLAGHSREEAVRALLDDIKISLHNAHIEFDSWFSENDGLRTSGAIEETLRILESKDCVEKRDGAVWLGDRVLVKSDGEPTYLLADLAYHRNKLIERNFDKAVTIVGADHHAEISYVRESVIKFFGIDSSRLHIIVMQLVRLMSGGREVRMSKREGTFITLDELVDEVGVDVARYFFLERAPETHMDFDLDLARERSVKNPVYYVQYAHARMCSIFEKAGVVSPVNSFELLESPDEFSLIKKLIQFPEVVEDIAKDYHVHRLPRYAYELARAFHNFYEKERIIGEDKKLMGARLAFVQAAQIVLRNTLGLMGISAPEKM